MKGGLMAALSENVLTVNMLLSVFFLPGIYAHSCDGRTPLVIITTPKPTAALSGSCLNVPCSFTAAPGDAVFDSSRETRGAWIKDGNYIFDISNGVKTDLVEITGNLSQKNCTSLFSDINTSQAGKYFLRIENGGLKGAACSDPLQITVEGKSFTLLNSTKLQKYFSSFVFIISSLTQTSKDY
ncbi:hypothetical protein ILYODFUR_038487 [Ilyodon furcidens]|uniref:Ig-like domain-containing protein n=1 Tax=Ilyodon furcidens TaxID=33524 RepID=A0ABV0U183_9TELE